MSNEAANDGWIQHLPTELRESFAKAQVRSKLNELHDDTPLSQDLASVYLDVSDATLKRMRASGKGPQYIQGMSDDGATSRNNKVLYTVGSLKDWIAKNRTQSTGHAAVRRGLMFASLQDILIEEPWWQRQGQIIGHALSTPVDRIDKTFEVVWLTVLDALKHSWLANERDTYSTLAKGLLEHELVHIKACDEAHAITMQINNGKGT